MNKVLTLLAALMIVFTAGCNKGEEVKENSVSISEEVSKMQGEAAENGGEVENERRAPDNQILESTTLMMTNEHTITTDIKYSMTGDGKMGRIVLATDAKKENGKLQLKESNYWCLVVLADEGGDGSYDVAYNLYYGNYEGMLSVDVTEQKINGKEMNVITMTREFGQDKEVREYVFESKSFSEWIL